MTERGALARGGRVLDLDVDGVLAEDLDEPNMTPNFPRIWFLSESPDWMSESPDWSAGVAPATA